jgi:hypothetical protein
MTRAKPVTRNDRQMTSTKDGLPAGMNRTA